MSHSWAYNGFFAIMFDLLSENINYLMTKHKVSALRLARDSGVPISTIKKLRNKSINNPTFATLIPIAKYFGVSMDYLLTHEQKHNVWLMESHHDEYPILNWEEAISWPEQVPAILNSIKTRNHYSKEAFALTVIDRTWSLFSAGSFLIVDPKVLPDQSDYIVAHLKDQKTASLKIFLMEDNQAFLQSLNISSNIVPFTEEYRFLGTVMECQQQLKRPPILQSQVNLSADERERFSHPLLIN